MVLRPSSNRSRILNGNVCREVYGSASVACVSEGSCLCGYQQDLWHNSSQVLCFDPEYVTQGAGWSCFYQDSYCFLSGLLKRAEVGVFQVFQIKRLTYLFLFFIMVSKAANPSHPGVMKRKCASKNYCISSSIFYPIYNNNNNTNNNGARQHEI